MKISIWKEFKRVYKVAKKEFLIKFFTSIVLRGLLLVIPVLFSAAVNYATKQNYSAALLYIILSIIITIVYRLSEGINQKTFYNLYNRLYNYYNSRGIDKTNDNSIFSLSRFTLGQYTNMLTTDVDVISAFFANGVIRLVQLLEFIVIYAYFFALDVWLFIFALAVSIVVLFIIPMTSKKVEELNSKKKSEQDKQTATIHEYFKNIKDIKCFNIFDKIAPIPKNQTKEFLNANANYIVKYTWNNQLFLLTIEIFRLLSVAYGIYLIQHGHLEIGSLLIIYNYYQKIIDNFSTILTISVEATNLKVSLERFNHLVEYSLPKKEIKNTSLYITDGKIIFEDILYGYKNDPTLKNVSLEIEPNSLTAITGKAGTGQTGIFDLLLKLNRQHQGIITIDGTNINDIPDTEYFSKISLLRKNSLLFSMSIKENFSLVEPDFEKVTEICKELGIHEQIMSLKNGYDTLINENDGLPLSLKQTIAIARTILKSSKIMLFDDALLGLDDDEQNKVLNLLLKLKKDHTIVMIAHDKNILKDAEKIIVMDAKQVAESGTLDELIKRKGTYYNLFEKSSILNKDKIKGDE